MEVNLLFKKIFPTHSKNREFLGCLLKRFGLEVLMNFYLIFSVRYYTEQQQNKCQN